MMMKLFKISSNEETPRLVYTVTDANLISTTQLTAEALACKPNSVYELNIPNDVSEDDKNEIVKKIDKNEFVYIQGVDKPLGPRQFGVIALINCMIFAFFVGLLVGTIGVGWGEDWNSQEVPHVANGSVANGRLDNIIAAESLLSLERYCR